MHGRGPARAPESFPGGYAAPMADDDDRWPEPIHDDEELERARKAFADTYSIRRRILRYAYVVVGLLAIVVIVLALTR